MATRAELRSSLRALFGAWAGDRPAPLPDIPAGLPAEVLPVVREAVVTLAHYQGVAYARLYLHRLKRFIGRRDVDAAMFATIARRMAERMAYQDPVRVAQLVLDGVGHGSTTQRRCVFRLDELIEPLPDEVARPLVAMLGWCRAAHRTTTRRYFAQSAAGRARLRVEAGFRHWRGLSRNSRRERVWVERWLHMIDRALAKQPSAAPAVIDTATMIAGFGEAYRQGVADWHLIIDSLAKPTFDGHLALPDLGAALTAARSAADGDPNQVRLKQAIASFRSAATQHAA